MAETAREVEYVPPVESTNFLARLWRGQIPLGQTYWIYGVLGSIVIRIISPVIAYYMAANATSLSGFDIALIRYTWAAIAIAYSLFICVAIWRSANRYAIIKPKNKVNASLAQCVVVLSAVATVAAFVVPSDELKPNNADERMQLQASLAGMNSGLPKKIDDVTILTKIDIEEGSFVYYFDLRQYIVDRDKFGATVKNHIKSLCGTPDMVALLKSSPVIHYVYSDLQKNSADIILEKSDCHIL